MPRPLNYTTKIAASQTVGECTATPRDVIAEAITCTKDGGVRYLVQHSPRGRRLIAQHALDALAGAGYTVVPTSEYEELVEIKAERGARFPRCIVIKAAPDRDLYVGWSNVVEAPVWLGTRDDALGQGCPESRLRRADETGTSCKRDPESSYTGPLDGAWDDKGFIAEQRGWLPRARLGDYAVAYAEERMEDCWDLLEPFDDETEVRRG